MAEIPGSNPGEPKMVDPYEEIDQKTWEEIRLLEKLVDDTKDLDREDRISKINWFLNNQCEHLSLGHAKCRQRVGKWFLFGKKKATNNHYIWAVSTAERCTVQRTEICPLSSGNIGREV